MRIFHADLALAHMPNAPRMRTEQKHIAGQALDREIFVQRADHFAFGFRDHRICGRIRNGAAGGDRGEFRAAPAPQPMIHLIAMQQSAAAAARSRDAFRHHRPLPIQNRRAKIAVGMRGANQIVKRVLVPR